jgi:hypothetical protein
MSDSNELQRARPAQTMGASPLNSVFAGHRRRTVARLVRLSAALIGSVACTSTANSSGAGGFHTGFSVAWVNDSIWSHCEMDIRSSPPDPAKVATRCRDEDGPVRARERLLSAQEVQRLRLGLRAAQLFSGQSWGRDTRGLDGPLITLQVHDSEDVATLVAVKNESFETGPRQALLNLLVELQRSTDRGVAP